MTCPECGGDLHAWPWQDGGYKGVECYGCDLQWWSESFSSVLHEAERTAIEAAMRTSQFPADASTKPPWETTPSGDARKEGK